MNHADPRYEQSTGPINAGGNVSIQQVLETNRQLEGWFASFWKGPIGEIFLSVIATIIAAFLTRLGGLT